MTEEKKPNSATWDYPPKNITLVKPGVWFASPIPCPECGGDTGIVIEEWETETGEPKEGGFRLICIREEMKSEFYGYGQEHSWDKHFYWLTIWETTSRNALMWMKKAGIRVTTGNKD